MAAGFLAPVAPGAYALGPRFIELDRQIRLADPLLKVAPPIMAAQRMKVEGTQLLFRYYGVRVLSICEDRTDSRIKTSFDRGRPFTLFQGSHSRVILAHLATDQQQRLFLQHAEDIARVGLGRNWPEFRDTLRDIRERGVAVASDIDKDLIGVAAPIFVAPDTIGAALVLARSRRRLTKPKSSGCPNWPTQQPEKFQSASKLCRHERRLRTRAVRIDARDHPNDDPKRDRPQTETEPP